MTPFSKIEEYASQHHGGLKALNKKLTKPKSKQAIKAQADNLWLSAASKGVFQAGFNWQIVENKWPHFETHYKQFDLAFCRSRSDEQLEAIMKKEGLVKNWQKTRTIQKNADFFYQLSQEHGSLGAYFSQWNTENYCNNLQYIMKNGARLGGKTAQIFLRRMGVDSFVFSNDVIRALQLAEVLDKAPSSKKAWLSFQDAINTWRAESKRSLNEISQILAYSIG